MQEEIPDTKELMEEIMDTFKTKDIISFGPDKLAAGPTVESSKELIVVEGRADVLTLLRYGFTNAIATGGARIPKSLEEISRLKSVTIFLDGDHGADIQQQQLLKSIKVEYIARAPDGKEVEELTQKEINQALRRRIKASYVTSGNGTNNNGHISTNHQSTTEPFENKQQPQFNQLTKQPGIVKATKFSTTNDHKVAPRTFEPRGFENNSRSFDSKPSFENRQPFENRSQNKFSQNSGSYRQSQEHSPVADVFSQLLSEIPNIERVDMSREDRGGSRDRGSRDHGSRDNQRRNGGNDFSRSQGNNRFENNTRPLQEKTNFNRPEKSIVDMVREETESFHSKLNLPMDNFKPQETIVPQIRAENLQVKLDVPHTRGMEVPNKVMDTSKIQPAEQIQETRVISKTTISKSDSSVKQDIVKKITEIIEKKQIEEKPIIKEEPKKKVIAPLSKITDEIKTNLGKIVDDIKDKKEARLLNEKFRRISSCSAADLEHKLRDFTSDKLFAIAVDQDMNDTIKDLAKEKGAKIIVVRNSNGVKDSQIHVLTYQEINK
ncbi:MAG: toprim domain-containing protein [archaeon]|jgi:DNA primase